VKIAVVGLGTIGAGVAGALASAGHDLAVYDVRPEAAETFADRAVVASGVREAASGRDVVILAVLDDAQVQDVLFGTKSGAGDGGSGSAGGAVSVLAADACVVILSTISAGTLTDAYRRAAEHGVHVVDCGVTGGPRAAARGELVAMLGGDDAAVARVLPVVSDFGSAAFHVGGPGAGMRAKLARNLMQYTLWAAAREAESLAIACGVDPAMLKEIAVAGDAHTGGALALLPTRAGDERMRAAAGLAHKDLRAAIELADEIGVDVPIARLVEPTYETVFGLTPTPTPAPASEAPAETVDDTAVSDTSDVRERGLKMMAAVYDLPGIGGPRGNAYLDMTIEHLFGEVWTRPGLDITQRRLITIGVLAALGRPELLRVQFTSALARRELTKDQIQEIVVHLAHYVGWPQTAALGPMLAELTDPAPES